MGGNHIGRRTDQGDTQIQYLKIVKLTEKKDLRRQEQWSDK